MRTEKMIKELVQLRRGHGLHGQDVLTRVGPELRRASGIGPEDDQGEARRKLIAFLNAMIGNLPADLRVCVQAALALAPASEERFLKDRMIWLGALLDRDPRTAARRVESGLALLAEQIGGHVEEALPRPEGTALVPSGWHVQRLTSTLLLHQDPVQLYETRQIVSDVDGLDRIAVAWSVPRRDDLPAGVGIAVETLDGGELRQERERSTPTYWSGELRLPRPLARGEAHEYQVRVDSLPREYLLPYYVLSPFWRVDRFELHARFGTAAPPARVWALDGVPYRAVDEGLGRREVRPDALGEVRTSFSQLYPGLSYGLQWEP